MKGQQQYYQSKLQSQTMELLKQLMIHFPVKVVSSHKSWNQRSKLLSEIVLQRLGFQQIKSTIKTNSKSLK